MNDAQWEVGDWAVFDLRIVQIKKLNDFCSVSDGSFETSGNIVDRLRPLTLVNKSITETFDYLYKELRSVRGERGFNYPDINRYFCDLALRQIDEKIEDGSIFNKARDFIRQARDYTPIIDSVHLFRA